MKFHCDRCSTKYSIADERVRGKILKIRCKNCSDVITVRDPLKTEPAPQQAPEPAPSATARTVQRASTTAPESLEAEWYVSENGEQEGPYDLAVAIEWVGDKPAESELFCWSDGFEDWLPVEKVSHFRGVRPESVPSPVAPALSAPIHQESVPTPKPLFAATMAALGGEETDPGGSLANLPSSFSEVVAGNSPPPPTPAPPIPEEEEDSDLSFDIGEASRIVDVSALLAGGMARSVNPAGKPIESQQTPLPGTGAQVEPITPASNAFGKGSGAQPVLVEMSSSGPVLVPDTPERKKRAGLLIPLLFGGFTILLVAGILIYMLMDDDSGKRITRGTVGGSNTLGYSTSGSQGKGNVPLTEKVPEVIPETPATKRDGKGNGRKRLDPKPFNSDVKVTTTKAHNSGEVDLSGSGPQGPTGPLGGDDLMRTYRKNQIALKMCYERSLKKDPLLKVPKTWVDVRVGLSGKVTSVKINALAGSPLGTCLIGRIRRWKFRTTTEVFDGRFRVVFDK